ncbi:hypothetical protein [Pseudomonas cremoricolorata]|uniref:hypothetical protein n=1 Tax=Pseudomonas cremoricolorata TaxID=157783 RepID=UPI0012E0A8A6|nr:hypothetical protein [Pseudomonas cremoricolorata]
MNINEIRLIDGCRVGCVGCDKGKGERQGHTFRVRWQRAERGFDGAAAVGDRVQAVLGVR